MNKQRVGHHPFRRDGVRPSIDGIRCLIQESPWFISRGEYVNKARRQRQKLKKLLLQDNIFNWQTKTHRERWVLRRVRGTRTI